MSMDPVLFGVAAPAVASGAQAVGRAVDSATQSFGDLLQSAGHLFSAEPGTSLPMEAEEPVSLDAPRFAVLGELLAGDSAENLSLEDLQLHANGLQEDIQQRIQDALASAGIELEEPLQLSISGKDGSLEVNGAHPQRALIEAVLNGDQSLVEDFQKLVTERQILDHYTHSKLFAKEFAKQPWQAIAEQAGAENDRAHATLEVSKSSGNLQLQID